MGHSSSIAAFSLALLAAGSAYAAPASSSSTTMKTQATIPHLAVAPANPVAPGGDAGKAWIVGPFSRGVIGYFDVVNPDPAASLSGRIQCHQQDRSAHADEIATSWSFTVAPNGWYFWTSDMPGRGLRYTGDAQTPALLGWCAVTASQPFVVVTGGREETNELVPGTSQTRTVTHPAPGPQAIRVAP